MTTATLDAGTTASTTAFDVEDVEYLRHGDTPLLARVHKPRGAGPFPALVECHGGAWCLSDRTTEHLRHKAMASHGIVSIALDFRSGNEAPYPASVQDINYAVRWTKASARTLKTRPDLVGLSGQSSGGHLAMLVAQLLGHAVALAPGTAVALDHGRERAGAARLVEAGEQRLVAVAQVLDFVDVEFGRLGFEDCSRHGTFPYVLGPCVLGCCSARR